MDWAFEGGCAAVSNVTVPCENAYEYIMDARRESDKCNSICSMFLCMMCCRIKIAHAAELHEPGIQQKIKQYVCDAEKRVSFVSEAYFRCHCAAIVNHHLRFDHT